MDFRTKRTIPLGDMSRPAGVMGNPNFRRWFGDSKVINADGKPLVVYHGTAEDFSAFDHKKIGENFRADDRGFFFISDPRQASNYAENDTVDINKRLGANVLPVYVSLRRPLVINDAFLKREGMAPIGEDEDVASFWDNYQGLIYEWVDERNSDGVILVDNTRKTNGETTKMVVAFRPQQIKSAIGNRGSFEPNNLDITK